MSADASNASSMSSTTLGGQASAEGARTQDGEIPAPTHRRRGRKRHLFTPTQELLLRYVAGETMLHGGAYCSKRELAELVGRNVKTVDRCLADLRRRGLISVEMRFDERGAQVPSCYRAVLAAISDT